MYIEWTCRYPFCMCPYLLGFRIVQPLEDTAQGLGFLGLRLMTTPKASGTPTAKVSNSKGRVHCLSHGVHSAPEVPIEVGRPYEGRDSTTQIMAAASSVRLLSLAEVDARPRRPLTFGSATPTLPPTRSPETGGFLPISGGLDLAIRRFWPGKRPTLLE